MRLIGVADLVLVPGLLRGRPRWAWVAGRAGLNLAIVAFLVESSAPGRRRPLAVAAALLAVTTIDMRVAATLRAAER